MLLPHVCVTFCNYQDKKVVMSGPQSLRSAKDKEKDKSGSGSAAVKLHTTDHTPVKGGQLIQTKITDRKSQGPSVVSGKSATNKNISTAEKETEPGLVLPSTVDGDPSLKDVFSVVNVCKQTLGELCNQMKGVKEELCLVRQELQKTNERITGAEGRISQIEDDLYPVKQEVETMKEQKSKFEEKLDEMENRNRRDNVRLVGLPEKCEGTNPTEFLESWFSKLFGRESFSPQFAIERAHRVPAKPPPSGGRPRSILMKFLNFKDKAMLLRRSREMGNIMWEGSKVSLYPDFSPLLQKRRASFIEVKRKMQKFKLIYALLYPARLRVVAPDGTFFFESAEDATIWLEDKKDQLVLK